MNTMRFRNFFIILAVLLPTIAWIAADPDLGLISELTFGSTWVTHLVALSKAFIGVVAWYVIRKGMFDYPEADLQSLGAKAIQTPLSAAVFAVALGLFGIAFALIVTAGMRF